MIDAGKKHRKGVQLPFKLAFNPFFLVALKMIPLGGTGGKFCFFVISWGLNSLTDLQLDSDDG